MSESSVVTCNEIKQFLGKTQPVDSFPLGSKQKIMQTIWKVWSRQNEEKERKKNHQICQFRD